MSNQKEPPERGAAHAALEQFDRVLGTVRLRRSGPPVKPTAEALDGRQFAFEVRWQIEDDDSRYPGEWALYPIGGDSMAAFDAAAIAWIASGDVSVDGPAENFTAPFLSYGR